MKVLYATRLFSGLEASVESRTWKPTGVPTIYRLIEALVRVENHVSVILCAKDGHTSLTDLKDGQIELEGLPCQVEILAATPRARGPLTRALREMRHALGIVRAIRRQRPTLLYLDHANIWTAGVLARVLKTPVVLRVMGVYPAMRKALSSSRIADRILRWCYRAPYATVICTQDGSGVEPWLKAALNPKAPVYTLLNGVDDVATSDKQHPSVDAIGSEAIVVTFLGKLETAKGIAEFADGFLAALRHEPKLHALIIGNGSLFEDIQRTFEKAGADSRVTMVQRLPHAQVLNALRRSDIYISLNKYGNLSNANLEAMQVGVAMIIPDAQTELGIDLATKNIITQGAALRIDPGCHSLEIERAILDLAAAPEKRAQMAAAIRHEAQNRLDTWDRRISREIDILEQVSAREN